MEKLRADNRWVKLANIIPWDVMEPLFADGQGASAKPLRMALGAFIIKEKCRYLVWKQLNRSQKILIFSISLG